MSLGTEFREAIEAAGRSLASITDDQARLPFREGGWLRVELLGHLIDSCLHNHVRFLTAANSGALAVARYDQHGCVRLHAYGDFGWQDLLGHWRMQNELLARVVERVPPQAHAIECRLEDGETMRLDALIRDYLTHLRHHLTQLTGELS